MRTRPFQNLLGAILLCSLGPDILLPPPREQKMGPDTEFEALAQQCTEACLDLLAIHEAAGGPSGFAKIARTCLEMQTTLHKIKIKITHIGRLLLHDRMVSAQEKFGRTYGAVVRMGFAACGPMLSPQVQQFADYEARCAREAALCGCGPAGRAQLDAELRGVDSGKPDFEMFSRLGKALFNEPQFLGNGSDGARTSFLVEAPRIEKGENTLTPKMKAQCDAWLGKALHPAGRCTCGAGGGYAGTCEWCVMDRRRMIESERKTKHRKSVKARRGW